MKWIYLFILFFSFASSATEDNGLYGSPFNMCDTISGRMYQDYFVEFFKEGVEYEAEIYLGPSELPCKGKKLFIISRTWGYEKQNDEIVSTLKMVGVMIYDSSFIALFNDSNFCNHSNWKVNKMVDCTGKNIFGYEPLKGQRSINQFKINDDKLHLINSSKEELILKKYLSNYLSWFEIQLDKSDSKY